MKRAPTTGWKKLLSALDPARHVFNAPHASPGLRAAGAGVKPLPPRRPAGASSAGFASRRHTEGIAGFQLGRGSASGASLLLTFATGTLGFFIFLGLATLAVL